MLEVIGHKLPELDEILIIHRLNTFGNMRTVEYVISNWAQITWIRGNSYNS